MRMLAVLSGGIGNFHKVPFEIMVGLLLNAVLQSDAELAQRHPSSGQLAFIPHRLGAIPTMDRVPFRNNIASPRVSSLSVLFTLLIITLALAAWPAMPCNLLA